MAPGVVASGRHRNQGIDSLRGLSILLVVLHHIGIRLPLQKTDLAALAPDWLLTGLNGNGTEAVFTFFVISGFLITRRVVDRAGELNRMAPGDFYARRAARILPSLVALVVVLSLFHLLGVPRYVIYGKGQSVGGAALSAFGLYLNWYEGLHGYLPGGWDVLWSLSIEELFYLAFPLVCLTLRREWMLALALILLVASLPFTHAALKGRGIWQEKAYLPGISAIALGVLTALASRRLTNQPTWLFRTACVVGVSGIGAIFFAGSWVWNWVGEGYLLVLVGAAALLVLGLDKLDSVRIPGLSEMGRLSYEIYLTHMFCVFGVLDIAGYAGTSKSIGFVWYVPVVLSAWGLGACVERYFSTPCEVWLRNGGGAPWRWANLT